jgi:hypothetical protein
MAEGELEGRAKGSGTTGFELVTFGSGGGKRVCPKPKVVWTPRGPVAYYFLFFFHLHTHRVRIAGMAAYNEAFGRRNFSRLALIQAIDLLLVDSQ